MKFRITHAGGVYEIFEAGNLNYKPCTVHPYITDDDIVKTTMDQNFFILSEIAENLNSSQQICFESCSKV